MSNNKYKILIVEDEHNIQSFMVTVLETNGYQTITADTCQQGLLMFSSHLPDIVILDLGLPDKDGLEFIKEVRKKNVTPIIVLSARTSEMDKVAALDLGANDYMTKPFGTAELSARVRVALRNSRYASSMGTELGGKFTLKDMMIDYDRRQITIKGEVVKFTQTEYNIMALLSIHAGKVMTYASIIRSIWGEADDGSVKKLQVNMANIRKKLGCKPGDNMYIVNELGVGYRMVDKNI